MDIFVFADGCHSKQQPVIGTQVMRSTFSSIIKKRVYTLDFDRGSEATPSLLNKLETARRASGVVIATPTTLKSIQLKFLELLSQISDVNRPVRKSQL